MSNEDVKPENVEEREFVEDTPENRAWIGETEPKPVEDAAAK